MYGLSLGGVYAGAAVGWPSSRLALRCAYAAGASPSFALAVATGATAATGRRAERRTGAAVSTGAADSSIASRLSRSFSPIALGAVPAAAPAACGTVITPPHALQRTFFPANLSSSLNAFRQESHR